MKAMILAAGLGTRLRPLTDDRPKALVEVGGRTLLELAVARLRSVGVTEVIVNVHHFAGKIADYLQQRENFGMRIEISREEDLLLDTGGGLKKAAWFFLEGGDEPFVLHNVDVISSVNLTEMLRIHQERGALATLAVQQRQSSRQLLFDETGRLCGRRRKDAAAEVVRRVSLPAALAFCGIHVISPRLLGMFEEDGAFSIIDTYLRLASRGEPIYAFRADQYYWRDLGKPENVRQAARELEKRTLSI